MPHRRRRIVKRFVAALVQCNSHTTCTNQPYTLSHHVTILIISSSLLYRHTSSLGAAAILTSQLLSALSHHSSTAMTSCPLLLVLLLLSLLSGCFSAQLYHRHGSLADAARASSAPHPSSSEPWQATAVAPLDAPHSIILALTQLNLDHLQQLHRDIHDPSHPSWLQHLSAEQLHAITALPSSITDAIIAWLRSHGVGEAEVEYPIASDTIRVTTAVRHLNSAFNTTLHSFTHSDGQHSVYRQLGPSYLPDEFLPHIDFVDGLALFPLPLKHHSHVITEFPSHTPLEPTPTPTPAPASPTPADPSTPTTTTSTPTSTEPWGASPSGCGFYGIFPVNSLYGRYNISDQSGLSLGAAPTTSTSTLQFWTLDSNNNPLANSLLPHRPRPRLPALVALAERQRGSRGPHLGPQPGQRPAGRAVARHAGGGSDVAHLGPVV